MSPEVAREHFLEVLEAKKQRNAEGPSYPAANAFTGRHDVDAQAAGLPSSDAAVPSVPGTAHAPESTYGASLVHARGNQGMRKQR
ncbi:hypothetical protein ACQQ2N_16625 [Dokdonella sp. MW10]|uniref:hypothetical protein n=1 Tax=Dokdonella sp. MW10 TaxID=2992926 RepID=UPI003F7F43D8